MIAMDRNAPETGAALRLIGPAAMRTVPTFVPRTGTIAMFPKRGARVTQG